VAQLTGIWGLYPCAYRQFNVDDLMLNAIGVVVGFLMARGLVRTRGEVRD
jgi:glycopeptide antibiotics resistance protein